MGNPARAKVMRKGGLEKRKGGIRPQGSPDFLEHLLPKPESACLPAFCFPPTLLMFKGAVPHRLL